MIKTMKPWIAGLCAGALAALAGPALADYPEKPVTMIVAYSPGGGTDTAARRLSTTGRSRSPIRSSCSRVKYQSFA